MSELFVRYKIVDPSIILSADITLINAKGYVWHKSSMTNGVIPQSGIDTEARWLRFGHTNGWIFGYKLHLVASTNVSIIVPLAADFTTANITDNQLYSTLTTNLPVTIIKITLFMSTDPGYDDHKLYDLSTEQRWDFS